MEHKYKGNWRVKLKPGETITTKAGTVITNNGNYPMKFTINETAISQSSTQGNTSHDQAN